MTDRQALGIDIGGSGIKGALVDLARGKLASKRIRLETPAGFGIEAVSRRVADLVARFDSRGSVGIGFPAAVANGVVLTPPTAHHVPGWVGEDIDRRFSEATGRMVRVLNDADAAGLAEVRYGAGRGVNGVVIVITLGTGVGAGLFVDGQLVPNLEIGKLYLAGHEQVAEQYMASRVRTEQGLSWEEYGERLQAFCLHVEHLFSPRLIIIGGGISRLHKKFLPQLRLRRTEIVPARLRNQAGIVGAAAWADQDGTDADIHGRGGGPSRPTPV